ncbi:MAG: DNA-binding FadR family transcriptional regulator [Patiriisocius sp.]
MRLSVDRLDQATQDSEATEQEARRLYELVAIASKSLVLGFLVNSLHRMSQRSGIQYDLEHRQAFAKNTRLILETIEAGDVGKAHSISRKMHAASKRYWEKHASELLETPVSWIP